MAPLALVHGNPGTPAVWDHLAPSLEAAGRDPVRLSPPGFGAAVLPDFQATPAGCRDSRTRDPDSVEDELRRHLERNKATMLERLGSIRSGQAGWLTGDTA